MKKAAKTSSKPSAPRGKKAVSSEGGIVGPLLLDQVLGSSFFYANIRGSGDAGIDPVEIPFEPPAGALRWFAVASLSHVGHLHDPRLGVLTVLQVDAAVSNAQDGTHVVRVSGAMQFDRQAPDSSCAKQIDVFGHVTFYSAAASQTAALKRFEAARIKILASRSLA
jgi:hypothetical protein